MTEPAPTQQALRMSASPYFSPLIEQLASPPDPLPACASCPASMWRATPKSVECVCKMVGKVSWTRLMDPTIFCDGREVAIARLKEESG